MAEIKIGRFTIMISDETAWIRINSDMPESEGEGMQTTAEKLEKVIADFYNREF